MKDWDSHTLTARVIAVSRQLIALWEAFLLLAGTGWGRRAHAHLAGECQALVSRQTLVA